ncbi:MAG: hypothetical protein GXY37_06965 [Chloroflexi bacterium]|nr:hypothetical protein [Chloroflexota bacterium]
MNHRQTIGFIGLVISAVVLVMAACQPLLMPPGQMVLNPSATQDEGDGFVDGLEKAATPVNTPVLNLPSPTAMPGAASTEIPAASTSTPVDEPLCVGVDENLPAKFIESLRGTVEICESGEDPAASIGYGSAELLSEWVFALTGPFNTVIDGIAADELFNYWTQGQESPFKELILDQSTLHAVSSLWGKPVGTVTVLDSDQLLERASKDGNVWAILPFEAVSPRWKVISLDEQTPLSKHFDPATYPLTVPIGSLSGELSEAVKRNLADLPKSNRVSEKLTTVILTGVTALARATAYDMEIRGVLQPAEEVADELRDADILHISNEVPFAADCPYPNPYQPGSLKFCSDFKYMELFRYIGTDVVDLTGDHMLDYGQQALLDTLAAYRQEGLPYFGSGINLKEAQTPVKFDINGNKIAFVGCNGKKFGFLAALDNAPGVFECGMDRLTEIIDQLTAEGYNPIVTFQHDEVYSWHPSTRMIADFTAAANAGAVIVNGSQGHQPQAMAFVDGNRFIHYGLGNLFFDQFGVGGDTDKAFIDRHIFYDNRYIGTELLTVKFLDYSTPRWMNKTERNLMLGTLFLFSEDLAKQPE